MFLLSLNSMFYCSLAGPCDCWWSDWIDVSYPTYGPENGEYETYDNIREWNSSAICEQPVNISCRAQKFPDVPIEELGQKVQCNVSTGLICNNKDQKPGPVMPEPFCLNYEIKVCCLPPHCIPSTTSSTTTRTTTPTTTTETPTTTPTTTTESPTSTSTSTESSTTITPTITTTATTTPPTTTTATTTPGTTTLTTTTPTTTTTTIETTTTLTTTPTTTTTGTTTLTTTTPTTTTTGTTTPTTTTESPTTTTTESPTPTPTTTTESPTTTSTSTESSTTTPTTTATTTMPTSSTTTETTTTTNTSATTTPELTATTTVTSTPETTTPTSTTTATTTSKSTTPTTTTTTSPKTTTTTTTITSGTTSKTPNCTFGNVTYPPGGSFYPCNCTEAICTENTGWELRPIPCNPPPKPTCTNGLDPVAVMDKDNCCWHWECNCYCTGWGDPHYKTFDGRYYSYQGNCTYILMEEIHKTIDNFGVYIDNYHCDVRDKVSCPRTLIVKYQTQEVLIRTVKMIPMQVQVFVNEQKVALPYEKYNMKVGRIGINYIVEIRDIGNITYNGVAFSISLIYNKFANNTQGQCGTCTNNTADDCMLPGGKIIENCETMADHWMINDPNKPHCSPSLTSTVAPPMSTLSPPPTCKPSALCELIKGSVFQKCHATVSYVDFYAACVFDSCAVPNSQLECASLQVYATICANEGVCVDWRGHTRGACSVTCPSHKIYKACGPIEEVTCKSSQVIQDQTHQVEGCFCPDGTMPFGDGVDVCVETCGCVGPDNEPRKFGERFEFDCKDCICLEGGSGIICVPHKCAEQVDKPTCNEEGFYPVTEVSPDNICCNVTSCRCNVSFCTTKPPKCDLGYKLVSKIDAGNCCPVYECVPKGVCVLQNAEYSPGSPVYADKCHDCKCTNRTNSTGMNIISCKHIPCIKTCQQGYELQDVKGECCQKCVQTKCIVRKGDNTALILSPGEKQNDPKDNCTIYSCVKIEDQLISSTSKISCPSFSEENCKPGTVTLLPNGCCKTCIPQDSPTPCSVTQILDFITHKGCRSVDKVYLTQCEGSCGTFSIYSAEANSMEHKCSCCRETVTSEKEVLLQCPNGRSFTYKYLHVDRCECLDTHCTEPNSSENSQSKEESKGSGQESPIERTKRALWRIMK
uniref:Mucin-2 n=1 Tax=Pelusios castaneus TaxID=367368 RepID=A0A8C8SQ32_9SAUR